VSLAKRLAAVLLTAALAACSGGQHNDQASTGSQTQSQDVSGVSTGSPAAPVNDATPQGAEAAGNGGAAAAVGSGTSPGEPAPVPSSLNCGAVQPVWVNERSHVYHEPADPLYGRTKHGEYMCPSAAIAAGYHKARGGHGHWKKNASGSTEYSPAPLQT